MKHKHYDAIIAYANGEEVEGRVTSFDKWVRIERPSFDDNFQYRPAEKRTVVGRFSFPISETRKPRNGTTYYLAVVSLKGEWFTWVDDRFDNLYFDAGLLHLTLEGAEEHLAALKAVSIGDWQ